ncbi:hypothetical protein BD413DRAFT_466728 [Trametes elegans]|nr:hypothetical protein BD413DRAFT_466728 [Trametes elegans]
MSAAPTTCLRFVARRYLILSIVAFGLVTLAGRTIWSRNAYYFRGMDPPPLPTPPALPEVLPPLYARFRETELHLPQERWEQRRPRADEKFLFVAGHSRGCGWGNAMQELLLNAYMAYKAGRSFVFANYTWNDNGSQYSEYNGKKIPSLIPYSAIIQGPIVGAPFPPGDHTPPAVHRDYFDAMCPHKVTYIREDISETISFKNSAKEITDGWANKLARIEEPCIQTAPNSRQIYNFDVFGDPKAMIDIWPELSASPILTHFGWSPLVELAFDNNRDLFLSSTAVEPYLTSSPFTTNAERYSAIPGLMAIHLRRGDFEAHCEHLGRHSARYAAFNSLPALVDTFEPPPPPHAGFERGTNSDENMATYRARCFPSVAQVVERVRAVRATPAGRGLSKLYIMTNADREFIKALKTALWRDQPWEMLASSRDVVLNWEQTFVAQALDMLVGQRAQVFVGNGFSTLTANVVTMRMANRFPPESTRFW